MRTKHKRDDKLRSARLWVTVTNCSHASQLGSTESQMFVPGAAVALFQLQRIVTTFTSFETTFLWLFCHTLFTHWKIYFKVKYCTYTPVHNVRGKISFNLHTILTQYTHVCSKLCPFDFESFFCKLRHSATHIGLVHLVVLITATIITHNHVISPKTCWKRQIKWNKTELSFGHEMNWTEMKWNKLTNGRVNEYANSRFNSLATQLRGTAIISFVNQERNVFSAK